jgi:hypothetical protein
MLRSQLLSRISKATAWYARAAKDRSQLLSRISKATAWYARAAKDRTKDLRFAQGHTDSVLHVRADISDAAMIARHVLRRRSLIDIQSFVKRL